MANLKSILGLLYSNDKKVMTEDDVLGTNQEWTAVSRVDSQEYTNDTGKPITVNLRATITTGDQLLLYVGILSANILVSQFGNVNGNFTVTAVVPAGHIYKLIYGAATGVNANELRGI